MLDSLRSYPLPAKRSEFWDLPAAKHMHSSTGGSPETKGMCRPVTICPRLVPTRNRGKMKPPRNPDSTVMLMAKSFVAAMIAYQPGRKI